MGCNTASNANGENVPSENNEFTSQSEGSISIESAHCSIQNQIELSIYEKEKELMFQMLTSLYSDSKTRSRLMLVREFVGKVYFGAAKFETHGIKENTFCKFVT